MITYFLINCNSWKLSILVHLSGDCCHRNQPTNQQPLSPLDMAGDLEYADMDFRSYGPINYKAASIYAMVKKNKGGALQEVNHWK